MWTTSLTTWPKTNADASNVPFPPLPKIHWPKPPAPLPILTEPQIADTIIPKRTFLVHDAERAIAAIYESVNDEYVANEREQDPLEKLHYLMVDITLLAKLFECIDVKNLPHSAPDDENEG